MEDCFKLVVETAYPTIYFFGQWRERLQDILFIFLPPPLEEILATAMSQNRNRDTLCEYVTEYEQMWTWMDEFLSKFHGSGIKIDRVISIRVGKPLTFLNILCAVVRKVMSLWAIVFFPLSMYLLLLNRFVKDGSLLTPHCESSFTKYID